MAAFNYDKGYTELRKILEDIQQSDSGLEDLSKKLKNAKELVKKCKAKLRDVEADIQLALEEE